MVNGKLWTQQEVEYVKENYGKILARKIAKKLKRSYKAIQLEAKKLKLHSFLDHTPESKIKSKETKIKIRLASKQRWKNLEYRKKRSKSQKKLFQNLKYRKEHLERLNEARKKRKFGKEWKEKISKSIKKLWENPEYAKNWFLKNREKPTLPEKQIIQIIKLNKFPFNYVGNGKVRIDRYYPDFLSKNLKYIIEIYGEYHHNLLKIKKRDRRRKKIYKILGYKLLVIWSLELENPQKVTEKIIKVLNEKY